MICRAILVCTVGLLGTIGCRAPKPTFNAFAPFGSPRVPPPPTGAYQQSGTYYAAPNAGATNPNAFTGRPASTTTTTPAAVGTGTKPANTPPPMPNLMPPPTYGASIGSSLPGFVGVGNSAGGSVVPASYAAPVQPDPLVLPPATPTIVTGSSVPSNHRPSTSGSALTGLKLKGMPVNDATRPPATQVLPPNTNRVPALLQVVKPRPANSAWQSRSE